MPRRRRTPQERAFEAVAVHVEEAKRSLLVAVPGARRPPAPLAGSLMAYEEALRLAREAMAGWREPEEARARCAEAIEEASRRGEWLRLEAPSLDFESLVLVLGDILAPLEAFVEAEHAVRTARPRP